MATLRVHLFGKFRVAYDGRPVEGLESRKVQELFSYLLLQRGHPQPRESLVELLWSESASAASRKNLRQLLWQLQSALEPGGASDGPRLLAAGPDWVEINARADLWLDVAELERAAGAAQGVPGRDLNGAQVGALRDAASLYEGDLLEGCYQDWCLFERERLQAMYLGMLDKLMAYCEAHQDYESGLDYGERILRYDRARESTHRQLMRLHSLAGERTAALRQYRQCVEALEQELGVKPSRRTTALYEQLRADGMGGVLLPGGPGRDPDAVALSLTDVLSHLTQLQTAVADIEAQIQKAVQAVKTVLNHEA